MKLTKHLLPFVIGASISGIAMSASAEGTASAQDITTPATESCASFDSGQRFDADRDLLIAHYDIKPDVDDLHAIAAFATILARHGDCFDWHVVVGTYGTQGGEYIDPPGLLNGAFGNNWSDAHNAREAALTTAAGRVMEALDRGGTVWVAEGGQSDFTADLVTSMSADRTVAAAAQSKVRVIQHSEWNEGTTTLEKLALVQALPGYLRIPDGNGGANGTPDFAVSDASWWPMLLRDPGAGDVWAEAKRLADLHNPTAAYVNPAVAENGLDFSDTAEIAYILGFEDMPGHEEFFQRFLAPELFAPDHDSVPPMITRWMNTPAVLLFSKTQAWRHNEGIAGANAFFSELATSREWAIYTTANGAVFRPEILERFDLVVFNNMTGDTLSKEQEEAFRSWLAEGGAWMGLHAAGAASHTDWQWYDTTLVGPEFVGHPSRPQIQEARLETLATEHPVMSGLPTEWMAKDEWYSFDSLPSDFGFTALLGIDESTYNPWSPDYGPREDLRMGDSPEDHPVVWVGCVTGARTFYSALGHDHTAYWSEVYRKLLSNAFDWVTEEREPDSC